MAEKSQLPKLPMRKTYAWNAQVTVDMPIQLGRERRVFHLKGEKTFEFLPIRDPNRAALKLTHLRLTLPETDLVLSNADEYWMDGIHIPELTIDSDAIDLEGSEGFVELATGRFTLQFTIRLTPEVVPLLKKYRIEEVPILVQEAGQVDLGEGDQYSSWLRFAVAPEYAGEFQFYCGGGKAPEPRCPTYTKIAATLDLSSDNAWNTVYICAGDKAYLRWTSSKDVTAAEITPGIGSVQPTGQTAVGPTTTTDYTIRVTGECSREEKVRVHVIQDGDEMDLTAIPKPRLELWEYSMPVTCVSQSIRVTSIRPVCGLNCYYQPVLNMTYVDCGNYLCHGHWSCLKEDPDGHLHSFALSLFRIDLPEYPWAGTWQFWPLGLVGWKTEGNAYFVITVKCKG